MDIIDTRITQSEDRWAGWAIRPIPPVRALVSIADIAQLVERLVCNEDVAGSIPAVGSISIKGPRVMAKIDLLRQCDAVLACDAVTGHVRAYWLMLRERIQPSLGSIFG